MFGLPVLAWSIGAIALADATLPDTEAIVWVAPPECPGRASILTRIERRLGHIPAIGEFAVDGTIVRDELHGYTLHLELAAGTRSEAREVHDPSCETLADAAALLVVAALERAAPVADPDPAPPGPSMIGEPRTLAQPTPQVAAPVAPPAASAAPIPVPDRKDMRKRPGWFARVHGGGELGAVPGPTGAVGLATGPLGRRWRVELQGTYLAPRTAVRTLGDARVQLVAGAVHGCGRLGRGALEVPLCLGVEVGAMRGENPRLAGGTPVTTPWAAVVLGAGLSWRLHPRVGLVAALQLVVDFVRPRFELGDSKQAVPLFRSSPASGRLLLGLEVRLRDPW